MGLLYFINHFNATLAAAIGTTDTVLTLELTDATTPTIPSGGLIPLSLLDTTNPAAVEVVYCTAASSTQFTVIRGMEGTTAQSWSAGVSVIAPPSAGAQQLFTQAGYSPPWSSGIAAQIGGYQQGAIVQDSSGTQWRSLVNNNFTQPGTTGASWVNINLASVPIGAMMDYLGSTVPPGWLLCAGQLLSRTTYAALFAVIGPYVGAGDGSTTFNAPDARGRVMAGQDNMGGSAAGRLTSASGTPGTTLGGTGGNELLQSHNHTISDPGHDHSINDPGHNHSFNDPGHNHYVNDPGHNHTISDPGHNHAVSDPGHFHGISWSEAFVTAGGNGIGVSGSSTTINTNSAGTGISINLHGTGVYNNASGTGIYLNGSFTGGYNSAALTGIYNSSSGTGISLSASGNGSTQNVQPTLIVNKIIYAGA